MAVTHAAGVRDDLATVVRSAHDVGSGAAVLQIRESTTVIIEFPLGDPAFGAPASAIIALNGTPIEVNAEDSSAGVDNFVTRDKDGTQVLAGSVTAVGMGGDIEVTNINIADLQDCSIDSLTYEAAD